MQLKEYFSKTLKYFFYKEDLTQSQLVEVQRAFILKSTVQVALVIISLLTLLWGVVDYYAFSFELWFSLLQVRLVTVALMMGLVWYIASKGFVEGFEYFLYILPLVFFGFSYHLLQQHEHIGFAQVVFIVYENIPYVVMAGIGLMPLRLYKAFTVFLMVFASTLIAYKLDGTPLLSSGLLAQFWLLLIIGGMAIIISSIQYKMLSSLVNKNITDPLTGALTRAAGQLVLDFSIAAVKRGQGSVAIVFLDIDRFKSVNDNFGHEAGDEVLKNFVKTITSRKRDSDAFVRWGGEEFLLILPSLEEEGHPKQVLERILGPGIGDRPDGNPLTVSGGVEDWTKSGAQTSLEFVQMADEKMYMAKEQGRNRIIGYWNVP